MLSPTEFSSSVFQKCDRLSGGSYQNVYQNKSVCVVVVASLGRPVRWTFYSAPNSSGVLEGDLGEVWCCDEGTPAVPCVVAVWSSIWARIDDVPLAKELGFSDRFSTCFQPFDCNSASHRRRPYQKQPCGPPQENKIFDIFNNIFSCHKWHGKLLK